MKSELLVLTGHDQDIEVTQLGMQGIQDWAKANREECIAIKGDKFRFAEEEVKFGPYFARYRFIAEYLQDYEYVLWLDADVVPLKPLENAFIGSGVGLAIAPDINDFVNTGVMLWRSTERRVLDEISRLAFDEYDHEVVTFSGKVHNCPDQGVVGSLLKENYDNLLTRTMFMPASKYNAMPQFEYFGAPTDCRYASNSETVFLHLAGVPDEKRLDILRQRS